jgi:hypothetical protein
MQNNNALTSAPVKTCRIVAPDSPDYIRQTNAIYPDLVATPGYQAQRRLGGTWVVIVERTCRNTVIDLARRSGYEVQE